MTTSIMIKQRIHYILTLFMMVFMMPIQADPLLAKPLAHIKMVTGSQVVVIALFDTPASQQLLDQLPLSLELSDFAGSEKIAYLPQKLILGTTPQAKTTKSDFTYYAPWGNLAIFYRGYGQDNGVYALGAITEGKEYIANIRQNTTVTLTRID